MATYYTVKEVAEQLNKSEKTIRRHIKEKKLGAIRPGGWEFRISDASLDAYKYRGGRA